MNLKVKSENTDIRREASKIHLFHIIRKRRKEGVNNETIKGESVDQLNFIQGHGRERNHHMLGNKSPHNIKRSKISPNLNKLEKEPLRFKQGLTTWKKGLISVRPNSFNNLWTLSWPTRRSWDMSLRQNKRDAENMRGRSTKWMVRSKVTARRFWTPKRRFEVCTVT